MEPKTKTMLDELNSFAKQTDQVCNEWYRRYLEDVLKNKHYPGMVEQVLSVEEIVIKNIVEKRSGFTSEIIRRIDGRMYYPHTQNDYFLRLEVLNKNFKDTFLPVYVKFKMFGKNSLLILSLLMNGGFGLDFCQVTYLRKSHILFEGESPLPKEAIIKGFEGNAFSVVDGQMFLNEEYHDGLDGGNRKGLEHLAALVNTNYAEGVDVLVVLFNECLRATGFEELYYGLIKLSKYGTMINRPPRHFKTHDDGNAEKINLIEALFLHEVAKIIY